MSEKIMINILSREMMPNFIAILEMNPDRVVALTTERSKKQLPVFETMTGIPHEGLMIDPFDFQMDYERVCQLMSGFPVETEVVLNFTGGTKVMSLAASLGCIPSSSDKTVELIYVDTERGQIEKLKLENGRWSFGPSIPLSIPVPFGAYIQLAGETITSSQDQLSEIQQSRAAIAKELLNEKYKFFFLRSALRKSLETSNGVHAESKALSIPLFNKKKGGAQESASLVWNKQGFEFDTNREKMTCSCEDSASFFNGKWLEEFAFHTCLNSEMFDTVIGNVVLSLRAETIERERNLPWNRGRDPSSFSDKNEIDLVVTKGARAALCECKSGQVRQEDLYKLEALRSLLLGRLGIAVLISRLPPQAKEIEKMSDMGMVCIYGHNIMRLAEILKDLLS